MKKLNLVTIISKFKTNDGEQKNPMLTKSWGLALMVLGAAAFMLQFHKPKTAEKIAEEAWSMDSYIPAGHSLVPIQVENYENLDQLIGQFGVVDLYTAPLEPGQKPILVVRAVKLVRSGKNPRHFSILLPSDQASKIVRYHGDFRVSVRNPKTVGTHFVKTKKRPRKRAIIFDME